MPAPARQEIQFVGGTSKHRRVGIANQETVGWMQAVKDPSAKSRVVLEDPPGLRYLANLGDGPIRTPQMVSSAVRGAGFDLYGVYGSKLMAQTSASGNIEIGTLNTAGGPVSIARGRNYVMLVDGANGYYYNGSGALTVITDPDFPLNPTHVAYLDGFFIVNDASTDNFYICETKESPVNWNALDFEAAAVAPDNALALTASKSLLWILGQETAQAYYNNNVDPDFPYSIALTATQDSGILAPHSVAQSDDGIFYLATTNKGGRFVNRIQGQAGTIITREEQDDFLSTIDDPTTATGFIYKQAGKSFYVLQLGAGGPANDRRDSWTLFYNMNAGAWETREISDGSAWRGGGHGVLDGRNIVGSRLQGQHFELDLDYYEDASAPLIRRRRTQVFGYNNETLDFWEVEVEIEPAVGQLLSLRANPVLQLRYSNDKGRTWSDWLDGYVGKVGEYDARVVWRNLGSAKNRVFELRCDAAVPVPIIAAYMRATLRND